MSINIKVEKNMSNEKKLLIGFIIIYILRLISSQVMGIMPQDAYYYFYSEEIEMSYFDHPPMVALMLKLFTNIIGNSIWAIKLTDFLVTFGSFYGFYYLAKLFLSSNKAYYTSIMYGSTMMLTLLSINTTPDVPMIFFWTWSLVFLYKSITTNKTSAWLISGLLMGLSFDSKYTALFLPFGLIVFLLLSNNNRKRLYSFNFLLAIVIFLLTIFPVYWWNVEHDWISFKFQSSSRANSILKFKIKYHYFFGNMAAQTFIVLPFLAYFIILTFYKYFRRFTKTWKLPKDKFLFLISFSFPMIVFFFSLSIFYWIKINWIMPGYITAIILSGILLTRKSILYNIITSIIIHIALISVIIFHPFDIKSDDTWIGWKELSTEVKIIQKQYPNHFIFSDDGYKTSAVLKYFLKEDIYSSNIIGKNGLQFNIRFPNPEHLINKNALFIDSDLKINNLDRSDNIPNKLKKYFSEIRELEPVVIYDKNKKAIRKFYIYECIKYTGSKKQP